MDLLRVASRSVLVFEAKLANYEEARRKLDELYLPVARCAWPTRSVGGIIVLKSVMNVPEATPIFDNLRDAIDFLDPNAGPNVLHWLGRGPL